MPIFSLIKIPTTLSVLMTALLIFTSECRASYILLFVSSRISGSEVIFTYNYPGPLIPVGCSGNGPPAVGGAWYIGYPGYGYPGPTYYAFCTWNGYQYRGEWTQDVITLRVPLSLVKEGVCPSVKYQDYGISDEYNLGCTVPPIVTPLSCTFGSASNFVIPHGDVSIAEIKNNTGKATKTINGNISCTGSGSGTVKLSLLNNGFVNLASDAGGTLRSMLAINGILGSNQINVSAGSTTFEIRSILNMLNNFTTSGMVSGSTTLTLEIP
ncbi:MrpH family fimbial adhesin [Serratia aquatilis]|uniref:Fimbrial adhesin MrpH C-terminal domain-containing protein n=1 Tax=Serratia aquatilis TaxID=1737515 RepID=A0ABV6EIL4_9GAMM